MNKWKKFRNWANKNNGSFYQVDNQNLTLLEVLGYILCISAFIVYLAHEKIGFKETWLGWLFLIIGLALTITGVSKRIRNEKNT